MLKLHALNALAPLLIVVMALPSTAEPAADAPPTGPAEHPAAVFVVRHAEKETGPEVGRDPRLTASGRERASELVSLLADAGIDAVYATQWRRTRQTAAPIAAALGLEVEIVRTDDGFEAALAERIESRHDGEVVLVVGHSNTNPTLLRALGAENAPDLSEDDYDDVYLVIFPAGEPRLLRLGYGRPTP